MKDSVLVYGDILLRESRVGWEDFNIPFFSLIELESLNDLEREITKALNKAADFHDREIDRVRAASQWAKGNNAALIVCIDWAHQVRPLF
jgi:hypothetical protein